MLNPNTPAPTTTRRTYYTALLALALGSFAIGLGEFVLMGLLPEAAQDLQLRIAQIGHAIGTYALGVVIGAPLLALLSTRQSRTGMLIVLMALYALAHFASALAQSYESLLALRFISGLPHGTYFGIASLVAASLAPKEQRTQAVAYVMIGLAVATLAGVPLASSLGQWLGWRYSLALVGVFALLACLSIAFFVPKEAAQSGSSWQSQLRAFANKQIWLALGVGAIGFGGLFAIFSYVKPTLMTLAGLTGAGVPWMLALLGAGMVVGNLLGSKMADKNLLGTIKACLLWSTLVCVCYYFSATHLTLACITLFCLGTVVAIGPAVQVRLMEVAGRAQIMAAALNHSAFNFANASGAFLGGMAIDWGFGYAATGLVGALLSVGGLVVYVFLARDAKRCDRD